MEEKKSKDGYIKERRKFNKVFKERQEEQRKEEEVILKNLKNNNEIWKYI